MCPFAGKTFLLVVICVISPHFEFKVQSSPVPITDYWILLIPKRSRGFFSKVIFVLKTAAENSSDNWGHGSF